MTMRLLRDAGGRALPFVASAIVSSFVAPANASTWSDLPFAELVQKSELIVVAEVSDAGDLNRCTVRVLDTLKGSSPAKEIGVGGYNDRQGRSRSLEKGERFLLFLRKPGAALEEFGSLSGEGAEVYLRQPAPKFFVLPTPSSGDYPIDERGVRGNPFNTRWPEDQGPASPTLVFEVVRSLVQGDAGATALLESQLRGLADRLRSLDARNAAAKGNAVWLLFSAARLTSSLEIADEVGQIAAEHADPLIAFAGIELLSARGTRTSVPTLVEIVRNPEVLPLLRGFAASAAAKLGATAAELGPAIAVALPSASADFDWSGPLNFIPDTPADMLLDAATTADALDQLKDVITARAGDVVTARNATAERIAKALLHIRSSEARKQVIAAFEKAALDRDRYVAARFLLLDGNAASVDAVLKKLRQTGTYAYDVEAALYDFAFSFPDHPELGALLERHLDAPGGAGLFGVALVAGGPRTRALIENYSDPDKRPLAELVLRAMDAKDQTDPRQRVKSLLDVLDGRTGLEFFIRNAVLFEIVRSTTKGDEAAVIARIRRSNVGPEGLTLGDNVNFRALTALGAELTHEEEEQRRRRERRLAGPFATRR